LDEALYSLELSRGDRLFVLIVLAFILYVVSTPAVVPDGL